MIMCDWNLHCSDHSWTSGHACVHDLQLFDHGSCYVRISSWVYVFWNLKTQFKGAKSRDDI